MLRYVDENTATIWVEASGPCEVVLHGTPGIEGATARTFEVRGQHYALVVASGLMPGTEYEYQVTLDGASCWPLPTPSGDPLPPSAFVTPDGDREPRIVFGSCRNSNAPDDTSYGPDAVATLAESLLPSSPGDRPDVLLMLGDQVYADSLSEPMKDLVAARRSDPDSEGPMTEAVTFAEYSALYREAWTPPEVRWLLSVVPTVMIFDDHDVHDDWNTSAAWRAQFQSRPWWKDRVTGAYGSYWLYQHLGNLSPAQLDADPTWQRVLGADGDAGDVLDDLALRADRRDPEVRWSVRRDIGGVRVVVVDSRSRRVVDDDSGRRMTDESEWAWVTKSVTGDFDHVVLATSVPPLLPRGIHALETWSEKVCAGAWGKRFARFAEGLRQEVDLEHWPSFGASFAELEDLLSGLAAGTYGPAPATVTVVSGDVHHSYLAPVSVPGAGPSGTAVWHAVSSPVRNLMPGNMRRAYALASSAPGGLAGTMVARLAGARRPRIKWKVTAGPWFANMLATLSYEGRSARIRFDRSSPSGLEPVHESSLTAE